jgi:beta-phosphoglucomutase-like phosphatase (HAD superfamily)
MFSGYIFDVEGTLVDSVPQTLRSLQEALEDAGIDVPYEALQLYSGLDGNQTLQIIAPDLNDALRTQILSHDRRLECHRFATSPDRSRQEHFRRDVSDD